MKNKSKSKLFRPHGRTIVACLFLIAFVAIALLVAGLFSGASAFAKGSELKVAAAVSYQATVLDHTSWTGDVSARRAPDRVQSKVQPTVGSSRS